MGNLCDKPQDKLKLDKTIEYADLVSGVKPLIIEESKEELKKLEEFNMFPKQVVHALNPVPLDQDEEENQLIMYSWLK